jgi:hypothetical protein
LVAVACLALAGVTLLPADYTLCPPWEVTVVDPMGLPLAGMTARLFCKQYSLRSRAHEHQEDILTDRNGHASFGKRTRRASLTQRGFGAISLLSKEGVRQGFGSHAFVFAFGNGMAGSADAQDQLAVWTGKPDQMETRIVAVPMILPKELAQDTKTVLSSASYIWVEFYNPSRAKLAVEMRLGQNGCAENPILFPKKIDGDVGWVVTVWAAAEDEFCYRIRYLELASEWGDWEKLERRRAADGYREKYEVTIPYKAL